jgi:hypothetical protein
MGVAVTVRIKSSMLLLSFIVSEQFPPALFFAVCVRGDGIYHVSFFVGPLVYSCSMLSLQLHNISSFTTLLMQCSVWI